MSQDQALEVDSLYTSLDVETRIVVQQVRTLVTRGYPLNPRHFDTRPLSV